MTETTTRDESGSPVDFLDDRVRAELLALIHSGDRHRHDGTHLAGVLRAVGVLEAGGESCDGIAVRLAAWFREAATEPGEPGAGDRAGALAERLLDPASPVEEVARLARLAGGHRVEPGDLDAAVFCDADLAVLGSPAEVYDEYVAAVRLDFAHVPDERFRAGRAAVLEDLLGRECLFHTSTGRDAWERRARANLHRELADLRGR